MLKCSFTSDDAFCQLFAQLTNLRRLDISGALCLISWQRAGKEGGGERNMRCLMSQLFLVYTADSYRARAPCTNLLQAVVSSRMMACGASQPWLPV